MNVLSGIRSIISSIIRKPLISLVKLNRLPEDPVKELKLDTGKPILYVLKSPSNSNLTLLDQQCKEVGLPSPLNPLCPDWTGPGYLFIGRNSFISRLFPALNRRYQQRMQKLTEYVMKHPTTEVQLVPVSIFWGRQPGKENSLFRVLVSDVEDAGIIRKFFIILFQRKHTFIRFSKPVDLKLIIKDKRSLEQNTRTLNRVLRVHFHRRRLTAMGPLVADRRQLINTLLSSEAVVKAIKREAEAKKTSPQQARKTARRYAMEIAANQTNFMVRFLDKVLTWLWNKIYNGIKIYHSEKLREIADDAEIIYVPCHRSHMDYLLLGYTLYRQGLMAPHIAAGINLNFWPIGSILRGGGAFFIRRSFAGNKLYTAVFNEYLHTLYKRGLSVKFFPEGGRSRTGRLLNPKSGMVAMTMQSFIRGVKRPLVMIPVYIGYDRIMEGKEYLGEMHGKSKKSESVGQLLGVRKVLKRSYGKAYVNFGNPINLHQYIDTHHPKWESLRQKMNNTGKSINELKPTWFMPMVKDLAIQLMQNINDAVVVNSVNLVSTILLATERNAIDRKQLITQLDCYLKILREHPYSEEMILPEGDGESVAQEAESLGMLQSATHAMGNVTYVNQNEAVLLSYYRNNTLHLFIPSGLIASCFIHESVITEAQIIRQCKLLYPIFKSELFLHWDMNGFARQLRATLKTMAELGLIIQDKKSWQRADVQSQEFSRLNLLAETTQPMLERFVLMVPLLNQTEKPSRNQLENQSKLVAERLSILHKINAPEFFDKKLFATMLQSLRDQGLITGGQGKGLASTEALDKLFEVTHHMVRSTTQRAIKQALRAIKE